MDKLIATDSSNDLNRVCYPRCLSYKLENTEDYVLACVAPSKEAWQEGIVLTKQMLDIKYASTGKYPKKVILNLWAGEFKRSEGSTLAQCLYLLGVEPIWDLDGVVRTIRCIPIEQLKRPRIDVIIQTSGLFRDIGISIIALVHQAVNAVTNLDNKFNSDNYVRDNSKRIEQMLCRKGFSSLLARYFSASRIFGASAGSYGTGIIPLVENSCQWNTVDTIAKQYIELMGMVYIPKYLGQYIDGLFEIALHDVDAIIHPLSNDKCGLLSLDHIYEYVGGISMAVTFATEEAPDIFISDVRDKINPCVRRVDDIIHEEKKNSVCSLEYIQKVMNGDVSYMQALSRTFRNIFGWNILRPSVIPTNMWRELFDIYVVDINSIGIADYFETINPNGFQIITGVLLEAIRKKLWYADRCIIAKLAQLHARLVIEYKLCSSMFVTGNVQLIQMIESYLTAPQKKQYRTVLKQAVNQPLINKIRR